MKNISYPSNWGIQPEVKFVEIHWHPVINGLPKEKDVYLVTVHSEGIEDYSMSADWNGETWSCELFGDVIAWALFPKPYKKAI